MGHTFFFLLAILLLCPFLQSENTQESKSVLTVSPSWLTPGASVTLKCEVQPPSAGWAFYWYKAVPDPTKKDYRYELLSDGINGTVEDFYIIRGQKNTAGYACRAEKANPDFITHYSQPKFVWSADAHPAASLTVSPEEDKHFTDHNVSLKCGGNLTEWKIRSYTVINNQSYLSDCSTWWTVTGSSCVINSQSHYEAVWWCESKSGEYSNAVSIPIYNRDLLLVSPFHPVTEGASITLTCRLRGQNTLSNVIFYHNDKLLQNDSRQELKISAVSQLDEGFYKCEHLGMVSPQSWMAVQAVFRLRSFSFFVLLVLGAGCGCTFIMLLLLLCCFRQSQEPDEFKDVTYASINWEKSGKKRGENEPEGDDVHFDLKTGAAVLVYGVLTKIQTERLTSTPRPSYDSTVRLSSIQSASDPHVSSINHPPRLCF
ncbi:uncharacterized protein LOC124880105 isoform X2 [Girardinichthys multiradiatus]|uniref:uncharacterized protein LOC124880105 isoform X2 n=1 Tax=Girardinichthys multiradiatus TaxID=208333 RepID=UPI001FAC63AB|nr:uncharacterized protein LOC124880105 isoform X2 [Girardinichthys multiradiatus]